jgi:hypothetical protein
LSSDYTQTAAGKLEIELGSATAFDRLVVGNLAALDGTLEVRLAGNYLPTDGTRFDILDWGSRQGIFSATQLPVLPAGMQWDLSELYSSGTLSISGLAGDFNTDSSVDAADYVVWRNSSGSQAEYNMWRANIGRTMGTGSALVSSVPEPSSLVIAIAAVVALCRARSRLET